MIVGFAYKPNTSDFRNTRVIEVYNELRSFGIEVDIYDSMVDKEEVLKVYGVELIDNLEVDKYNLVIDLHKDKKSQFNIF